jgi:hypothetical protein
VLLLQASRQPAGFAAVVLGIQAVGAVLAFALALRPERPAPLPEPTTALGGREREREPVGLETA